MLYFDTSFLVPLILPEKTSNRIAAFIRGLPAGQLTVSYWTRVEFSSLIAREVRMGGLDVQAGAQADARFEAMIDESFLVLQPSTADFDLAKAYLGSFEIGLRAGDALHLAIARNRGAGVIHSLDKTLQKAGTMLGFSVSMACRRNDRGAGRHHKARSYDEGVAPRAQAVGAIARPASSTLKVVLRISHPRQVAMQNSHDGRGDLLAERV